MFYSHPTIYSITFSFSLLSNGFQSCRRARHDSVVSSLWNNARANPPMPPI